MRKAIQRLGRQAAVTVEIKGADVAPQALAALCRGRLHEMPISDVQVVVSFAPTFTDADAEKAIKRLRRTGYSVSKASRHESKGFARGWGGPEHLICISR
jgi:hypothetical protein